MFMLTLKKMLVVVVAVSLFVVGGCSVRNFEYATSTRIGVGSIRPELPNHYMKGKDGAVISSQNIHGNQRQSGGSTVKVERSATY